MTMICRESDKYHFVLPYGNNVPSLGLYQINPKDIKEPSSLSQKYKYDE